MRRAVLSLCLALFSAAPGFCAEPFSTQPVSDPVPHEMGAGSQRLVAPLPPQFPAYLPNGAINLDEAWIQDGGARLYWNTIVIPRQLKMAGASWVDPALVPLLIAPANSKQPARRYSRSKVSKSAAAKSAAAPTNPLTEKSTLIPLPVEPLSVKPSQPARTSRSGRSITAPVSGAKGAGSFESYIPQTRLQ